VYKQIVLATILISIYISDLPAQMTKLLASDPDKSWYYGNAVNISDNYAAILVNDNYWENNNYTIEILQKINNKWVLYSKINENDQFQSGYEWGSLGSYLNKGKLHCFKELKYNVEFLTNKLMIYDIDKKTIDSIISQKIEFIHNFGYNGNWLVLRKSRYESKSGIGQNYIVDLFYRYVANKLTLVDSIKFKNDNINSHPHTSRINISENFTIVGFDRDNDYGILDGSVNIYKRTGEKWDLFQKIIHHNPYAQYNSRFGIATAISEDERFLVVGAIFAKDKKGKVYIYELHGDKYELFQTINEPATKTQGQFGNSISFKNNILLIGHSKTQDNSFKGKVYYYTFKDSLWQLKYTIQPPVGDTKYESFGISVDQDGEACIAGADFDKTYHTISGAAYIFHIPARDTVTASVCKSEGYAFGDTTYYESGTYRDTLIASYGVDSVVVLNLTVLPVYKKKLDTVLCEGQTVQIGDQIFNQSGHFTVKLISSEGCDSTIDLTLRVIDREYPAIDTFFCTGSTITLQGQNIASGGIYSFTLENINGCDSIISYNVTMIDPDKMNIDTSFCEGKMLTIRDKVISEAGTYNFGLKNGFGCDSIVSYIVTELPVKRTNIDTLICEGEIISIAGNVLNQPGQYIFTVVASSGCDSLITLDLKTALKNNKSVDTVLCAGQSIKIGDQLIDEAGEYSIVLKNINDCDSTVNIKVSKSELEVTDEVFSDLGCKSGRIELDVIGNKPPFHYLWNTGSTDEDLLVAEKGNYVLTVIDDTGCRYEFSFEIFDSTAYLIPEAFTPDDQNEELNRTFWIYIADQGCAEPRVKILSTEIFNRWGERVFSSAGRNFWDGTFRNQPAPAGVYLYSMIIESPCGVDTIKGQVLLLR
jgi:hypothetical protein